jgi:hypothetical protein
MLKNLEIAQDEPYATEVQCWGRSSRSGSSSALSFPLSLISSLQLDELELKLEDELEELEHDDHLEGPLLLLGWRVETLDFTLDVANEDGDAWGGRSAPAYIAQWGEPQPSDQTNTKEWSRCIVEVSWRLPHDVDLTWRWAQVGRPHLSASGLPLRSRVFSCPLEPSRQFSRNSDLIWFGFLTPTSPRLILFLSLKIHNSPKLWKLLC